jgi:hypothetical protein
MLEFHRKETRTIFFYFLFLQKNMQA